MKLNKADPDFGKLRASARQARQHLRGSLPPVLVFTDPARSAPPLDLMAALPEGWGLVYRHFGARNRREIANELAQIARIRKTRLLIGADPDLARAVGADGVHWPERMTQGARTSAKHFQLNTLSAHSAAAILGPQPLHIQARILSTIFASKSPSASAAMGPTRLRQLSQGSGIPIYALGGINSETAPRIAQFAGLSGVGVL